VFCPSQNGELTARRKGRAESSALVHDIDGFFPVRNTCVHVQSENEIGARDLLHVLDDGGVALIGGNEQVHPMRKRMGAG
jgi:hypothetical protein